MTSVSQGMHRQSYQAFSSDRESLDQAEVDGEALLDSTVLRPVANK